MDHYLRQLHQLRAILTFPMSKFRYGVFDVEGERNYQRSHDRKGKGRDIPICMAEAMAII